MLIIQQNKRNRLTKILSKYPDENFFMSANFLLALEKAEDLTIDFKSETVSYQDGVYLIPPIEGDVENVFVDYEGYVGKGTKTFWDYEFIYDPVSVFQMKGKKYRVFRHNVKKYLSENNVTQSKKQEGNYKIAMEIYEKWAEFKLNKEKDIFNDWIYYADRLNIDIIYSNEEPLAFNIWDNGPKYIHYIFNFNVPGHDFLNETSRWIFYSKIAAMEKLMKSYQKKELKLYVNDGGTMGIDGLMRYKRKLNPLAIRERFSWGEV